MLIVELNRHEYEPYSGRLLISWIVPSGHNVGLWRNQLEIRFSPPLETITDLEVANIFCGCLLPHFALFGSNLTLNGLPGLNAERLNFWRVSPRTGHRRRGNFRVPSIRFVRFGDHPPRSADLTPYRPLFWRRCRELGPVALIKHTKPYLMTVDGPSWMNSDYDRSSIKGELQKALALRYGLEFLRIWTDARTLFPEGDEYVNKYITGSLFYYTLLPLMRRHAVGVCYLACELEYALYELPFDLSLHARFIHKVSREPDPPLLSPLNAIPKVDLLDDLYRGDPELCSYLYSCLQNSAIAGAASAANVDVFPLIAKQSACLSS